MLDDIFGDSLLRLREPVVASAQFVDHVARTGAVRCGLGFGLTDRHTVFPLRDDRSILRRACYPPAPQSRSHSSPHKSTLALDIPQQVIARIGLRPFIGIGT